MNALVTQVRDFVSVAGEFAINCRLRRVSSCLGHTHPKPHCVLGQQWW